MNLTYYYTLNARETLIIYQSIISLQITRMILSKSFTPQTTAAKKNYTTEYTKKNPQHPSTNNSRKNGARAFDPIFIDSL